MFETQSERCPVKHFQKYISKRPVGMEKSGPFCLQPIINPLTSIWYKETPMGINSMNPFPADPGRREKFNLNFYFHTFLWCLKRFYEGLKGVHKIF